MARNDTAQALEDLRVEVTQLAEQLVAFETSAELALLRNASALRGRSAEVAAEAVKAATDLWVKYPALQGAVEQLDNAVRNHDAVSAAQLLTQSREQFAALTAALAQAREAVDDIARRWRSILPRVDEFRAEILQLQRVAADVDSADDTELEATRRMVEHLMETVAEDPLGTDTLPVERALERVRGRLRKLETMRLNLPADLERAQQTIDELARVIAEGRDAIEQSQSRIVGAATFLEPLDPDVLDDGPRALRPWLARLAQLAAQSQWRPASTGLAQWTVVAEGMLSNARAVLAANSAPLAERDELRGLFEAYRAKAAAAGRAEDIGLAQAAIAAREVLYSAPCNLDDAAAVVRAYIDAVNAVIGQTP